MKRSRKVLLGLAGTFVLMQIPQCPRTNPPVSGELETPADVKAVLRRACYDCHSNETAWRWYARVAPSSWLVHRDVVEGRRHLNFSEWDKLAPEKRAKRIHEIDEQVTEGDMPPWFYVPLHATAKLSEADKKLLVAWSKQP